MKLRLTAVAALVALAFALPTGAIAEDTTVEMLNKREDGAKMVYSEDITRIEAGDTVTWVPTARGHNVQFIAGPEGWKAPKKSKLGKEYSYTFDTDGVYVYVCTPHAGMGMLAMVVVGEASAEAIAAVEDAKVRGKSKKKFAALLEELTTEQE